MEQFEYTTLVLDGRGNYVVGTDPNTGDRQWEDLNRLGALGWQLVGVQVINGWATGYFMRQAVVPRKQVDWQYRRLIRQLRALLNQVDTAGWQPGRSAACDQFFIELEFLVTEGEKHAQG